jgi:hypothetical protein
MSVIVKRNGPEGPGDENRTTEKEKARRKKTKLTFNIQILVFMS